MAAIIILLCLKYASQYAGNDFLFPFFPFKSTVGGGGGGVVMLIVAGESPWPLALSKSTRENKTSKLKS